MSTTLTNTLTAQTLSCRHNAAFSSKHRKTWRDRARQLLQQESYIQTLNERLITGHLHPVLEATLWLYAYGDPKQDVPDEGSVRDSLKGMSPDELAERVIQLSKQLAELPKTTSLPPPVEEQDPLPPRTSLIPWPTKLPPSEFSEIPAPKKLVRE